VFTEHQQSPAYSKVLYRDVTNIIILQHKAVCGKEFVTCTRILS